MKTNEALNDKSRTIANWGLEVNGTFKFIVSFWISACLFINLVYMQKRIPKLRSFYFQFQLLLPF